MVNTNRSELADVMPFAFEHEYEITGRSPLLVALDPAKEQRPIVARVRAALRAPLTGADGRAKS